MCLTRAFCVDFSSPHSGQTKFCESVPEMLLMLICSVCGLVEEITSMSESPSHSIWKQVFLEIWTSGTFSSFSWRLFSGPEIQIF